MNRWTCLALLVLSCATQKASPNARPPSARTASPEEASGPCYVGRWRDELAPDHDETPSSAADDPNLKPEALVALALARQGDAQTCYEQLGLRYDSTLAGTLNFRCLFDRHGRVKHVGVLDGTMQSEAVRACIGRAICSWRFPSSREDEVLLDIPIVLAAKAAAP